MNYCITIKLNFMKQIMIIVFIALLSAANFSSLQAADTTGNNPNLPVALTYAGTFKDQPLIQLDFLGSAEDQVFRIVITDEAGNELYNANVKGQVFSKQFLINTDETGDAALQFEITGIKSGKSALYKVRRQRQVTQQIDVVKL